jgi:hypothetical protein
MPEAAWIRGRIVESQLREGAALVLEVGGRSLRHPLESAADGTFVVPVAVRGDSVALEIVDREGVALLSRMTDIRPEESCDLGEIQAGIVRHFRASVVDDRGVPVPDPHVSIWDASERTLDFVNGDENGIFPIATLPARPGTVGIAVDEDDIFRSFPCADLSRLDGSVFVVHALVHLHGELSRISGGPVGRTEIQACDERPDDDRYEQTETMSDRSGRFTLDLIPGRMRLFARPLGALEWVAGPEIDILPGRPASIDWVLK